MKKKHLIAVLLGGTLLFLPLMAHADVVWNFFDNNPVGGNNSTTWAQNVAGSQSKDINNPSGYPIPDTSSGHTIFLTAYEVAPTAVAVGTFGWLTGHDLGAGSDERGAGINPDGTITSNSNTTEVNAPETLKLTLDPSLNNYQIRFNSLALNEQAHVWAGGVGPGAASTVDLGPVIHVLGAEFEFVNIPNADKGLPIWITADTADILVYGVASVPEPATLLLLGLGLLGVGIQRRRARE